ncbi:hypothetical protein MP638_004836 [Amoeboaphelidium occidentale]|nr:hypothetical protein MP638_004836 [Amoeboaphelidium occidentale]
MEQLHKFEVSYDKWSPPSISRDSVFFRRAHIELENLFLKISDQDQKDLLYKVPNTSGIDSFFKIPLIQVQSWTVQNGTDLVLVFKCRDCWRFRFESKPSILNASMRLSSLISAVETNPAMYALAFKMEGSMNNDLEGRPWSLSSVESQFERLELSLDKWRISHVNKDFKVCENIPELIIVPAAAADDVFVNISDFRASRKVPHLVYASKSGGCLVRSGQPLVGTKGRRSVEDEQLVQLFLTSDKSKPCLVDTRTKATALNAKNKGGGTEAELGTYTNIRMFFTNLESPSGIRDCYLKFSEDIRLSFSENASTSSYLASSSQWLKQIQSALRPSLFVAKTLVEGCSILIHCDDGCDTSSVITSLAKIMADPYYRTIEGFQALIQEDWINEGFKFPERCGQVKAPMMNLTASSKNGNPSEGIVLPGPFSLSGGSDTALGSGISPVFLLFIEAFYQIWFQNPTEFEFNMLLPVLMEHHITSCKFGTFLGNNLKEKKILNFETEIFSLWAYLRLPEVLDLEKKILNFETEIFSLWAYLRLPEVLDLVRNAFYDPKSGLIEVSVSSTNIKLLSGLHDAFDPNNSLASFHEAKWVNKNEKFDVLRVDRGKYKPCGKKYSLSKIVILIKITSKLSP